MVKDSLALDIFLSPYPALIDLSLALTVPFPNNFFVNRSPSKLAPRVPNKIRKNYFVSFLIILVTPINKISESSKA